MKIYRLAKYYSTNRDDNETRVVLCPKCKNADITKTEEIVPLSYNNYPLKLCVCNKCKSYFTFYREDGMREISKEEAREGIKKGHLDIQEDGKNKGKDNHGHSYYVAFTEKPKTISQKEYDKNVWDNDDYYSSDNWKKQHLIDRQWAIKNKNCPSDILISILERGMNDYGSQLAAENPNTPPEAVIKWMKVTGRIEEENESTITEQIEEPKDESFEQLKGLVEKTAMSLDPNAWSYEDRPARLQRDLDMVPSPFGGRMIRQPQQKEDLQSKYYGVHFAHTPEQAAMYACGKATQEDPPVIIALNLPPELPQNLDVDALVDKGLMYYVEEKRNEVNQILNSQEGDEQKTEQINEMLDDDMQNWTSEGDIYDDVGDVLIRENEGIPPSVIQNYLSNMSPDQYVMEAKNIFSGNIPDQLHINMVGQFRVMQPVGSTVVQAIYQIPWYDFSSEINQYRYDMNDEDLAEQGLRREGDDLVNEKGQVVLDYDSLQYSGWLSRTPLYENKQIQLPGFELSEQTVWHGTTLSRAKQAYPDLLANVDIDVHEYASSFSWYKYAKSIEQSIKKAYDFAKKMMGSYFDNASLQDACLHLAEHLADTLRKDGFQANVRKGLFILGDNPNPDQNDVVDMKNHYWVETGGKIADLSGRQFNDKIPEGIPDIVYGTYQEFPRYRALGADVFSSRKYAIRSEEISKGRESDFDMEQKAIMWDNIVNTTADSHKIRDIYQNLSSFLVSHPSFYGSFTYGLLSNILQHYLTPLDVLEDAFNKFNGTLFILEWIAKNPKCPNELIEKIWAKRSEYSLYDFYNIARVLAIKDTTSQKILKEIAYEYGGISLIREYLLNNGSLDIDTALILRMKSGKIAKEDPSKHIIEEVPQQKGGVEELEGLLK